MSGGHFNDCGYDYYKVQQFADELAAEIQGNTVEDAWGFYYSAFNSEVIKCLEAQLPLLRRTASIMRAIDYLYSGDYGEDTFLREMEILTK